MMTQLWSRLQRVAVVRFARRLFFDFRQHALPVPAPLEISLTDLAPIWLRHNEDFRPSDAEGKVRVGSGVEMTMVEALTPITPPAPLMAGPSPKNLAPAAPSAGTGMSLVKPAGTPLAIRPRVPSSVLIRDYVMPYQGMLQTQNVLVPIVKMIDLLEEFGDCPSVVLEAKTQDEETSDLYSIRDTLAQVTLKDHTHRVTRHGLAVLLDCYKDPDPLIPKMLVACLGHDLGKIPSFRASGIYSMRDHPSISILKVKEAFEGHDVFWLDEVCEVIGAHHRHVKDGFASLLKVADGRAREEEVAFVSKTLEIKRWEDWFVVEDFLALIEPMVNRAETVGERKQDWVGVTIDGVVYCQPTPLYGLVRELARNKKIVDIHLLRASDKEEILRRLAKVLGAANILATPIGEGFYGRKYSFKLRSGKVVNSYCLPLVESAFKTAPSEFEARKTGYFKLIESVMR